MIILTKDSMPLFIDNIIVCTNWKFSRNFKILKYWEYFLEWKLMGKSSDKWVQNMFTSQISNDSCDMSHIVWVIHTSMSHTCESYFEFCKAQKIRKVHWSTYQGKWWKLSSNCMIHIIWVIFMSCGPWVIILKADRNETAEWAGGFRIGCKSVGRNRM